MSKNEEPFICSNCIKNKDFLLPIDDGDRENLCSVDPDHGKNTGVYASKLAFKIDAWFRANHTAGGLDYVSSGNPDKPNYEQIGRSYIDIMSEHLGCSEDVIDAIKEYLPDVSHHDISQGDEPFYDDSVAYETIEEAQKRYEAIEFEYWFESRFIIQWKDFCEQVIYHKRFFGAKEQLDALFGDPSEFEKGNICPLYTIPEGKIIYRARLLDNEDMVEKVRITPSSELGAPPKDRTRAGRMNVEFIPAFYGSFSDEIAVAEIRPGVGEIVAIGQFRTKRAIRVFDFAAFIESEGGDRSEVYNHTRFDFISQMEGEISKPVHQSDKQREYIPTQMVAEYLGEVFGCDAVIYRSSMKRNHKNETRNIVFLNKGIPYVGTNGSVLELKSHDFLEVYDLQYHLESHIPF